VVKKGTMAMAEIVRLGAGNSARRLHPPDRPVMNFQKDCLTGNFTKFKDFRGILAYDET